MKAAQQFITGVGEIEGIEVVGQPEMTVVAFKAARRWVGLGAAAGRRTQFAVPRAAWPPPPPRAAALGARTLGPRATPPCCAAPACARSPSRCLFRLLPPRPPVPPPSRGLDIYRVNDLLSAKGWHLNALQHPAALHICLTAAHSSGIVELLLRDLRDAVAAVLQVGGCGGSSCQPLQVASCATARRCILLLAAHA